ncbi:tripartite tricarboxylate transporter substrate-binding protein [Streptomyces sp. Je 1-4]|uniref:Bug family tripartite tricarboxylate transporter substrate binding protein n=1 Tax=Streptomyces TaxID=1883 RepID=UPI0021D94262|nr:MULTISPECIES: tripartite tricarboxylate transporter substrate-binding protein [unclassified Streptomyces]UYB41468.1 tripartite tricarboxylate transporter substrate-binding protein [Streptomyces sp. Je 1-4]UZQ37705.1 tripartite tricarboxylate transporter substrate-binding protein [Streptomyces sp. Je 1-4] [Streptomyces sp. Je 1-4 4N24]UZQ45122.1 tripartite tricarboxylate transporter substrate-binding protein [Streptomyces sp. Je 1-4] [Streptomyces sp. Je 1-4 4N24_ara]
MKNMHVKPARRAAAVLTAAGMLSSCAVGTADDAKDGGGKTVAYPTKGISVLAPGSPGGGWDTRARGMSQALTQCKVIREKATVSNKPGAGGTIGLAEFLKHKGDAHQLVVMDTVTVLGGIAVNKSPVDLKSLTPVAGLTSSPSAVVVPKDSPYKDVKSLLADLRKKPKSIKWTGGSLGGGDHIQAALLGKSRGVSPDKINYVPTGGGGETVSLLLNGAATVGISTLTELRGQIEAKALKVLAFTEKPKGQEIKGIDAPSLAELGLEAAAVRSVGGVLAPSGLSGAQQQAVVDTVRKMRNSSCWKDVLKRNDWADAWTPGDRFGDLIQHQEGPVNKVLEELGLVK